jgi:hypothetical protein
MGGIAHVLLGHKRQRDGKESRERNRQGSKETNDMHLKMPRRSKILSHALNGAIN